MGSAATKTQTAEAYCPHCFLLVEQNVPQDWPEKAVRCPHCRLLIGPGRGRPTSEASPGARGSAAGVFAHQAKREDGDNVSQDEIREAIRRVAEELGSRPERLLMVDYQQRASGDDSLPTLSDVFSAFGSWKRARREAAV
jgi:HNH endonuclease